MKGTLARALMVLCCFSISGTAPAAETNSALIVLKQLNARSQFGIGYKEYGTLVESTNVQVKEYLNSRDAKAHPAVRGHIAKAMEHHQRAARVWSVHIAFPSSDFVFENRPDWNAFIEYYPDGIQLLDAFKGKPGDRSVSFREMLSYMWEKAFQETVEAEKLYQDGSASKKTPKKK